MLVGPQIQAAVITVNSRAHPFGRRTFRAPDQRTIGKQPHRPTLMPGHGGLHRAHQLFVSELRPKIEPRRVSQLQKIGFNGGHGEKRCASCVLPVLTSFPTSRPATQSLDRQAGKEGDSYRVQPVRADSPRWVPAADGLTAPFTSQANRAYPALNTLIAPTTSAFSLKPHSTHRN